MVGGAGATGIGTGRVLVLVLVLVAVVAAWRLVCLLRVLEVTRERSCWACGTHGWTMRRVRTLVTSTASCNLSHRSRAVGWAGSCPKTLELCCAAWLDAARWSEHRPE